MQAGPYALFRRVVIRQIGASDPRFPSLFYVGREYSRATTHVDAYDGVLSDAGSTPAASTIRLAPSALAHGARWAPHRYPPRASPNGVLSEPCLSSASRRTDTQPHACRPHSDDGIVVGVHWVYMLRCADGALYIGETSNLDARLAQHQMGNGARFTAERRPVTLAYSEACADMVEGRKRERQLKRWTRAKKEALIAGDLALLKRL